MTAWLVFGALLGGCVSFVALLVVAVAFDWLDPEDCDEFDRSHLDMVTDLSRTHHL